MNMLEDDFAQYHLSIPKLTPPQNLTLWLKYWKEALVQQKCSYRTLLSYTFAIESFIAFSKKHEDISLENIGARYINRYLIEYQIKLALEKYHKQQLDKEHFDKIKNEAKLKSIGKNDANFEVLEIFENTLSQRLTVVKMFLKFVTQNNKEQHDYTLLYPKLSHIKIAEKFTDYLTESELKTVIEYLHLYREIFKDHKPKSSQRNVNRDILLLLICALTGARGEEVVHIKLKDLSLYQKENKSYYIIKIEKAKGGKKRSVTVRKNDIYYYVEYFKSQLPNDDFYLSSTYKNGYTNKPMHPNTLRLFANTLLKILGIPKRGLHAFRRGYVTKRISSDHADISIVAKELGNTSAILEKHYLKHSAEAFIK